MAIRLIEGFDHLPNPGGFYGYGGHIAEKGWSGSQNVQLIPGRPTLAPYSSAVELINFNGITKVIPGAPFSDGVIGFAWKYFGPGPFGLVTDFISTGAFTVGMDGLTHLYLKDATGTIVGTGTTPIFAYTWYYIEVKLVGGVGELHIDGGSTPEIGPVASAGFNTFSSVALYTAGLDTSSVGFDDIYVLDTTTSFNNDLLGDCHVETLYPVADGTYQQWSPDPGSPSTHYDKVNEEYTDGDSTYVFDSNMGDKDTYVMADLSFVTGSVFASQLNLYARKNQAGTREAKALIRQSGTDYLYPTPLPFGVSYRFLSYLYNTDPTGSAWTVSTINANECGMELST